MGRGGDWGTRGLGDWGTRGLGDWDTIALTRVQNAIRRCFSRVVRSEAEADAQAAGLGDRGGGPWARVRAGRGPSKGRCRPGSASQGGFSSKVHVFPSRKAALDSEPFALRSLRSLRCPPTRRRMALQPL